MNFINCKGTDGFDATKTVSEFRERTKLPQKHFFKIFLKREREREDRREKHQFVVSRIYVYWLFVVCALTGG